MEWPKHSCTGIRDQQLCFMRSPPAPLCRKALGQAVGPVRRAQESQHLPLCLELQRLHVPLGDFPGQMGQTLPVTAGSGRTVLRSSRASLWASRPPTGWRSADTTVPAISAPASSTADSPGHKGAGIWSALPSFSPPALEHAGVEISSPRCCVGRRSNKASQTL